VCNFPGFYHGGKDNKQVDDTLWILSLSYYDLPSDLKTCLLYLSVYPEDYEIEKECLIWKWVAEGFIQKKAGSSSLFEQGEEYFHELINRSMIQAVDSKEFAGIIYGCRVHDMVLDLIRDLSTEENFVTVSYVDDRRGTPSSLTRNVVRRLAHQNRRLTKETHQDNLMESSMRSLVACGCDIDGWVFVFHPSSKLLRVLALEKCRPSTDIRNLLWLEHSETVRYTKSWDGLGKLLHLRYLGLCGTRIYELPEEIRSLKFLQALDLVGTKISMLPRTVCLLTQLSTSRKEL
jgi:ribosomal protein S25